MHSASESHNLYLKKCASTFGKVAQSGILKILITLCLHIPSITAMNAMLIYQSDEVSLCKLKMFHLNLRFNYISSGEISTVLILT